MLHFIFLLFYLVNFRGGGLHGVIGTNLKKRNSRLVANSHVKSKKKSWWCEWRWERQQVKTDPPFIHLHLLSRVTTINIVFAWQAFICFEITKKKVKHRGKLKWFSIKVTVSWTEWQVFLNFIDDNQIKLDVKVGINVSSVCFSIKTFEIYSVIAIKFHLIFWLKNKL